MTAVDQNYYEYSNIISSGSSSSTEWIPSSDDLYGKPDYKIITYYMDENEISMLKSEKEILYEVLYSLMDEISSKKIKISIDLYDKIYSLLEKVNEKDIENDDGFIKREEMII